METASPPPPAGDRGDAIFNYDAGIDDFFKELDKEDNTKNVKGKTARKENEDSAKLGIDEVVKVRKRQAVAKLDEAKLVSAAGIPRLKKISKEKLKFKGKGHEFTDVARLLSMYQLWLDDLYPRAKFADALIMVEKLGHTKSIQMQRKEWIYEGKPKPTYETDAEADLEVVENEGRDDQMRYPLIDSKEESLFVDQNRSNVNTADDGEPEQDELDALLAEEQLQYRPSEKQKVVAQENKDDFADEMEAMAGMDDMW